MDMTNFVLRYGPGILGLLVRWTKNLDEAEDLKQNALLKSWTYFQENGVFPPFLWVKKVALREYYSWRRKRKPELLPSDFDREEKPEQAMKLEERRMVMLSVLALPQPYREVTMLHYIEGWPLSRVEQERGIPVTTAKMRLYRARLLLAGKLKKLWSN